MSIPIEHPPLNRLLERGQMTTIWGMNAETVWNVAKWVLLVLAAGFIGQFGKSLAQRIIEHRKRKRLQQELEASRAGEPSQAQLDAETEQDRIKAEAKIEKKRSKARLKQAKKDADSK